MIIFLSLSYFLLGVVFFYSYKSGYSLLLYLIKRKNINKLVSVELFFIAFSSFVVFTSSSFNVIVTSLMIIHVFELFSIIVKPNQFYVAAESYINLDQKFFEKSITFVLFAISLLVAISSY